MVCRVLVVRATDGITLIDTGFGVDDVSEPSRLGWVRFGLGIKLRREQTARAQLEAQGIEPSRVRDIVLSHLDLDHAGGIHDFRDATLHASRREVEAATTRKGWGEKLRYRPRQFEPIQVGSAQSEVDRWKLYPCHEGDAPVAESPATEDWFGFHSVPIDTTSLPEGALRFVSLPGHTRGHCGVAMRQRDRWLLYVGDSYYSQSELDPASDSIALRWFRRSIDVDPRAARATLERLRELRQNEDVRMIGSHDPRESISETSSD